MKRTLWLSLCTGSPFRTIRRTDCDLRIIQQYQQWQRRLADGGRSVEETEEAAYIGSYCGDLILNRIEPVKVLGYRGTNDALAHSDAIPSGVRPSLGARKAFTG